MSRALDELLVLGEWVGVSNQRASIVYEPAILFPAYVEALPPPVGVDNVRLIYPRGGPSLDAYLKLAQEVLRAERRPMSARALLAAAYKRDLVPSHLYGKTQHKTIGARLSEDIVVLHDRSLFFRTGPGRFFLREFLADVTLPTEYRQPVPTRRRFRELVRGPVLGIDPEALARVAIAEAPIPTTVILRLLHANHFSYSDPRDGEANLVYFRSFACVHRDHQVLSYRLGRYRENRDAFMSKRSIGFVSLVHDFDHTLFTRGDLGILECGVRAARFDLDMPELPSGTAETKVSAWLSHFVWTKHTSESGDLLAVIHFDCPEWFEPVKRRLAINDLRWIDNPKSINNIDDFDPWSQAILSRNFCQSHEESAQVVGPKNHPTNPCRLSNSTTPEW